jgi:hypothetical protein
MLAPGYLEKVNEILETADELLDQNSRDLPNTGKLAGLLAQVETIESEIPAISIVETIAAMRRERLKADFDKDTSTKESRQITTFVLFYTANRAPNSSPKSRKQAHGLLESENSSS